MDGILMMWSQANKRHEISAATWASTDARAFSASVHLNCSDAVWETIQKLVAPGVAVGNAREQATINAFTAAGMPLVDIRE